MFDFSHLAGGFGTVFDSNNATATATAIAQSQSGGFNASGLLAALLPKPAPPGPATGSPLASLPKEDQARPPSFLIRYQRALYIAGGGLLLVLGLLIVRGKR